MSEAAILEAARAVVASALPGWRDWSDDPAAVRPDKLGAFLVTVTRDGAVPEAMGSTREEVALTIGAELFMEYGPTERGRDLASARGGTVRDALRLDPGVRAAVDFVTGAALDVDLANGERRLARATVAVSVMATF